MSLAYCEKNNVQSEPTTTPEMREFSKRPGTYDENGKVIYFTEQNHKKECDVNYIIKKYDTTGLISHISKIEAKYGDMTGLDYKTMLDQVLDARNKFSELPSQIRKRFGNSPERLLEFMSDPSNREEAEKLGLINKNWTEDTDGIGEHIKSDDERKVKKEEPKKGIEK